MTESCAEMVWRCAPPVFPRGFACVIFDPDGRSGRIAQSPAEAAQADGAHRLRESQNSHSHNQYYGTWLSFWNCCFLLKHPVKPQIN
jgi:hypothetical protein